MDEMCTERGIQRIQQPELCMCCTGMNMKVWNKDQVPQENPKHLTLTHTHYHNLGARVQGLWYWKISLVFLKVSIVLFNSDFYFLKSQV